MNISRFINYIKKNKTHFEIPIVLFIFLTLALIYIYPILQGLILLPLDLLISNYFPWYSPGTIILKNNYMQDSILQMYPWRHLVYESLTNGIIPFWNPYQFMGAPFFASIKPLILYPTNLLFIFGEITSWNMLLYLQLFLSLMFSYLLARSFYISIFSSFLVAIAFSFNSLMIGVLQFGSEGHVILWIPLFILFSKKFIDMQKGRYLLLLGIAIALSIFAGQLQYTSYGLILLLFFILYYGFNKKFKIINYFPLFLSILLGIGLTSILLIPALELFSLSHRGSIDSSFVFNSGLINPILLLRLFSPDFFGSPVTNNLSIGYIETSGYFGIVALFFAVYAILFAYKNIFVKFFSVTFILSIIFSLKYFGSLIYLLKIPLITNGTGGRIFILVLISGAILSGFGLDYFLKNKINKKTIIALFIFSLIIFLSVLFKSLALNNQNLLSEFIHNIKFPSLALIAFIIFTSFYIIFKNKIKYSIFFYSLLIIFLAFGELFVFGYKFLTFSNNKFFYPKIGITNFVNNYTNNNLIRTYGLTEPELSTFIGDYSVETYNPLYLENNALLLQSLQRKSDLTLTDDNKYFLTKNEKLKNVLDFLGVGLIVSDRNINPSTYYFLTDKYQNSLDEVYLDDRFKAFINKDAFPRYYLVYDYVVKNDKASLKVLSGNLNEFKNKIILNESVDYTPSIGSGSAVLIDRNVNYQKFRVTSNNKGIFYISDTFYPGWKATVNGINKKIYKANYNFRAVIVPKGESIVEFNYLPRNFKTAVLISFFSFMGLISVSFFIGRLKKQIK